MWCRKRIDIGWSDLAAGLSGVGFRYNREAQHEAIAAAWPSNGRAVFSCLSVRSGWDLLLESLDLPPGSEVLMSALTIPDMAEIVKAHHLVPVPLDLNRSSAAPTWEILRRAITPRSKVVLAAHLFGSRGDFNPLIELAHQKGLLFVEDCAQAFAGTDFAGHPRADVSMFSFGTIKTATALGGGVFHLRDADLAAKMKDRQASYPVQSRWTYCRRLFKYSGLKFLSTYVAFSLFVACCRWAGIDPNGLLNGSVRGFAGGEGMERFRKQPSAPLLALMARRIGQDRGSERDRRQQLGNQLWERIRRVAECPGTTAEARDYWVFPVLADQPGELIQVLQENGFDATQGESMRVIERPPDSPAFEPAVARDLLDRMVYVPLYPELTRRAADRLADVLKRFSREREPAERPILESGNQTALQEIPEK